MGKAKTVPCLNVVVVEKVSIITISIHSAYNHVQSSFSINEDRNLNSNPVTSNHIIISEKLVILNEIT
jgi:hypothetical protein